MILILTEKKDQSTSKVIEWLLFFKAKFIVITEDDFIEVVKLYPATGSFIIKTENQVINSDDITSVWYRRGGLKILNKKFSIESTDYQEVVKLFQQYGNFEKTGTEHFLNFTFFKKNQINNQLRSSVNKLVVLNRAQEVGLNIPASIMTTEKKEVLAFISEHKKIITKPAIESLTIATQDFSFCAFTQIVTSKILSKYNDTIPLTFFQKYVKKIFEIRIFYIRGEFYSMAIFSQKNKKTRIDFRHYDDELPNRNVPFKLPKEIEKKINKLLQLLNINSASIDMLYGIDKVFYFLEINPIGQFGMTSSPCNYYLEKLIAEILQNSR